MPKRRAINRLINIKPFVLGTVACLTTLAVTCVSCLTLYSLSTKALRDEVRSNLQRSAKSASLLVDGDLHGKFTSSIQESSKSYLNALVPMARLLKADPDLTFVYTCILKNDKVYFILDPTPPGDADHDGVDDKSHIMQEYTDVSPELLLALRSKTSTVDKQPYTDLWGTFMSAYSPFYDSKGRFAGVVGVDWKADHYQAELNSIKASAIQGLLIAFLLSLVAGLAVAQLQKWTLAARNEAEKASYAKSEFLASMSHELRTPLNAIIGFSEVLEDRTFGELNPKQAKYVFNVLVSGRHLLQLINNILDISKIEAGRMELARSEFDLASAVNEVRVVTEVLSKRHQVALVFETEQAPPLLYADLAKFKQILLNLISNALKFTPAGGSVTVSALPAVDPKIAGEALQVIVKDTGIGIEPENMEKVFGEYEQIFTAHGRTQQGTGLGLSLVRRFVELHGGHIWVESEGTGKGSAFIFVIPLNYQTQELKQAS